MTLLEVVAAVVVLALVTVAVTSAASYTLGQAAYNETRLGAYELANRLIIQYLDDDTVINRTRGKPIDYNGRRFRWECYVDKVEMKVKAQDPGSGRAGPQHNGRYEYVTVEVWLDRQDRGPGWTESADFKPLASLSRLLDPVAARNPDAMARLAQDQNRLMGIMGRIGLTPGGDGGQQTPSIGGRNNRRSGGGK